ncbi:MAG: 3-hydroxyacyl-CoA dehydrogenase family protein [Planctomycetota bacterium]
MSDGLTGTQRRLVYPMLGEAVRCHQQRVVDQAWAIDLAMVLGTGFAPHQGGPIRLIESIGADVVTHNMQTLSSIHGGRFAPPERMCNLFDGQSKPDLEVPTG